jgi:hypothetical protein
MEPLNYCRQYRQYILGKRVPSDEDRRTLFLAASAHKFMLPKGGVMFDDPAFRAIADEVVLHLPFPALALEFEHESTDGVLKKTIIFAEDQQDHFRVTPATYFKEFNVWSVLVGGWYVSKRNALFRSHEDGKVYCSYKDEMGDEFTTEEVKPHAALGVLFSFLNALECGNVESQKLTPRKQPKKSKMALPFDCYHVLTIPVKANGSAAGVGLASGRSPREHLRRGHIRTYESGQKIWVNAAVVNPGVGGKISKDYRIAA